MGEYATELDRWKALAKIENQRMLRTRDARAPNNNSKYGPKMSEIKRNKSASEILNYAQQGFSVAEVSRFTATPVELVLWRAEKYRIPFRGGLNFGRTK